MKTKRFLTVVLVVAFFSTCTTVQRGPSGEILERGEDALPGQYVLLVGNLPNLVFQGITRKTAKLTMVPTSTGVSYATITAVTTLTPPVVNSSSPRTGVETNRAQFTAYVYAYNLPADNDFHVILGDTATFQTGVTNLINVEVSGRPDTTDTVFLAVRNSFLALVGNPVSMPQSTYQCVATPFQVTVTGGPFWDTSHPKGNSGTSTCYGGVPMKTINGWELHPVTAIQ